MTSVVSAGSLAAVNYGDFERPCWPLIWLWIASIAQYSYRYILQVNDPATSHDYGSTPHALSAIKYALFLFFVFYGVFCLARGRVRVEPTYLTMTYVICATLAVLAAVLLIRLAVLPGEIEETITCALELAPWIGSILLVPLVFKRAHDAKGTFSVFERVTFWIVFPFWLVTVFLAANGIRYPALSYPGLLIRFGGILDDPNGYACLCLLLSVLSISFRKGRWRLRAIIYVAMLLATLSFTGYITAVVTGLCFIPGTLRSRFRLRSTLVKVCAGCAILIGLIVGFVAFWDRNETVVDAMATLYSAKDASSTTHFSDLLPKEETLDSSSPIAWLCGSGGFSENFYWRILVNFGWLGFIAVVATLICCNCAALRRASGWRYRVGSWSIGILIGSNGIAYLLTFPLSLLYWSFLAVMIWTDLSTQRVR